ncbi:helix-turn-helix domain-containing protein [Caldalkalibacillus mannanilyticus]|uniref:helix-turn-helix domain-containing protein n=1 Tax=Caldalkalibacillus mannanilyticus TaxID=1418 RepID=UPI000467EFC7|nr:RodZ family helix-turn-helix domain-containing protein [Caldalkalibacillus mannanilyticus]
MSDLGNFLRQTREEKNITLDQVQEITKIRKRYLEAIENGEYGVLPGQFYARAFVKSYAEAIGLRAEEVLEQYSSDLPEVPKAPVETLTKRSTKEVRTTSPKIGKWISRVVLYSFIVLVVVLFYLAAIKYKPNEHQVDQDPAVPPIATNYGPEGQQPQTPPAESENSKPEDTDTDHADSEEKTEESTPATTETLTMVENTARKTSYELIEANKMEITLRASDGRIWYSLTDVAKNSTIDTTELAQGDQKTWDVTENKQVRFKFGNTKAITLLVNGKEVDLSHIENVANVHYIEFSLK